MAEEVPENTFDIEGASGTWHDEQGAQDHFLWFAVVERSVPPQRRCLLTCEASHENVERREHSTRCAGSI